MLGASARRCVGAADRPRSCRSSRQRRRRALRDGAARAPRPDHPHRAAAASAPSTSGSRPSARRGRCTATSSPSTTSPIWSRRSALRLGRRRPPHRPRDQEPADADPAFGRAAEAASSARSSPRTATSSTSAPTPSSARSATSAAWSTSSPSFARMPKPTIVEGNLSRRDPRGGVPGQVAAAGHRVRRRPAGRAADGPLRRAADGAGAHQRRQERRPRRSTALPSGRAATGDIIVAAGADGSAIVVDVIDNGIGLPRRTASGCSSPT